MTLALETSCGVKFEGIGRYEQLAALSRGWTPEEFSELERLEKLKDAATRKCILELRAQGFGARRIIARTGITKHYVSKILYGTQKRTPSSLASAYEKPQSGARAEARCFAHMVQAGEITQEQAEADIGISPADRAALEAFAAKHVCRAKMVQAALRLRDATLLEFRRILANATQPL